MGVGAGAHSDACVQRRVGEMISERCNRMLKITAPMVLMRDLMHGPMQVHAKNVALKDAQQIQGLRAMFGETYPDPVRMLTVGIVVCDVVDFCDGYNSDTR